MKLHLRSTALAVLTFGLTLHAVSSRAEIFDWNNVTYAPTATAAQTQTNLTNAAITDNQLSVKFTLNNNASFITGPVQSPNSANYNQGAVTNNTVNPPTTTYYYSDGGGAVTQKSLQVLADFTSNTDSILVTIFFAKPVLSLSFSIFDVDSGTGANNGTYRDQITAIGGLSTRGETVTPTSLTNANTSANPNVATNTIDSSTQATALAVSSTSAAAQSSGNGNINATFGSTTAITQLSFLYADTATTSTHAAVQLIALSNLSFTTVPEPGTLAMLGLGVVGAGAVAFRRRRA